jgi:hypothetical protein
MFKQICFILLMTTTAIACLQSAGRQNKQQTNNQPQQVNKQTATSGVIFETIPSRIDATSRYLFYLHGAILEGTKGHAVSPKFGVYEYENILAAFAREGFTVISELRRKGTAPEKYAVKVASQVNELLKAGVPPERITIVGASRGGGIAMIASALVKNRDVNFVILASCAGSRFFKNIDPDLYGNVLSIYDRDDDTGAGSCERFVQQSSGINRHQEIVLTTGLGHGIVYHPSKNWLDPLFNWAASR